MLVNVDRDWDYTKETMDVINRVGAQDCVIFKSPAEKRFVDEVEHIAPKIRYMPIIKNLEILEYARTKNLNLYGAEVLIENEEDILCSEEFISNMHKRGEKAWFNALDLNYHYTLSAHYDDTVSISEDPNKGWGWLVKKGFDIIQTDFPFELKHYLTTNKL